MMGQIKRETWWRTDENRIENNEQVLSLDLFLFFLGFFVSIV